MFRQVLPVEAYGQLLPAFGVLLRSRHYVVHSYAAICIDQYVALRDRADAAAGATATALAAQKAPLRISPAMVFSSRVVNVVVNVVNERNKFVIK